MNTVWIVLPVLIALMFQLGIELDRQAFAGVARRPAAVVAGLLGQLALLPLIAFGVGLAFRLPPVYFLGLLLVACCPGGSSSNVFSMLAKGDVALSVTLTALSSLITLFTIPLVMGFAARFVAVHAGAAIELPVGNCWCRTSSCCSCRCSAGRFSGIGGPGRHGVCTSCWGVWPSRP